MIELTREFRFHHVHDPGTAGKTANSWAGWFGSNQLAPFLCLQLTVAGEPQQPTGYVCNVKLLDRLLAAAIKDVRISTPHHSSCESYLLAAANALERRIPDEFEFRTLRLIVSPFRNYTTRKALPDMMSLSQQFEFSAAHRLHCPELSDEENARVFGKCNNASGHGHNYVVEVELVAELSNERSQVVPLKEFEEKVKQLVIDRLDHKHLNHDVEAFRKVNPSVENITQVIWNWLSDQFAGASLQRVRVYETPKTWAELRNCPEAVS